MLLRWWMLSTLRAERGKRSAVSYAGMEGMPQFEYWHRYRWDGHVGLYDFPLQSQKCGEEEVEETPFWNLCCNKGSESGVRWMRMGEGERDGVQGAVFMTSPANSRKVTLGRKQELLC